MLAAMNYYPHHIGDFNSATRHLTRVERSLYRDLIELYYDTEQPLPADDVNRLARRVIATTDEEKAALEYVLSEFFDLDGDFYRHGRCDEEIEKYKTNTSSKAKAGKASAEARKKKAAERKAKQQTNSEQKETPVEHPLNECATNQEPVTSNQEPITNTKKTLSALPPDHSRKFIAKRVELPPGIDQKSWIDWCEFRSSKKKPVSKAAAKKQISMLLKYTETIQREIVDKSISNDYQGLFEPKGGNHATHQQPDKPRCPADRFRALRQAEQQGNGSLVAENAGDIRPLLGDEFRDSPIGGLEFRPDGSGAGDDQDGTWPDGGEL